MVIQIEENWLDRTALGILGRNTRRANDVQLGEGSYVLYHTWVAYIEHKSTTQIIFVQAYQSANDVDKQPLPKGCNGRTYRRH